jgi:pimeloyl-ACP methyl ester carboxylesterase
MNVPPNNSGQIDINTGSAADSRVIRRVSVRPDLALSVTDVSPPSNSFDPTLPVFVLLHGLSSNALMWVGVADHLAARGYRSLSVDLRGHGLSDKPDGPYDLQTVTDDLAMLLDVEGLAKPVLAGQSWGANVVLEFAARFPGRTRGVMPVDGGFIELSKSFPNWEDCEREMAPPRLAGTPVATIDGWMRSSHPNWPESGIAGMMGFVEVRADGTAAPWLTFDNHIKVLRGLWEHHPPQRYPNISDPVWWLVAGVPQLNPSLDLTDGEGRWSERKHASIAVAEKLVLNSRTTWMDGDHDLHAQYPVEVASLLIQGVEEGFFT